MPVTAIRITDQDLLNDVEVIQHSRKHATPTKTAVILLRERVAEEKAKLAPHPCPTCASVIPAPEPSPAG